MNKKTKTNRNKKCQEEKIVHVGSHVSTWGGGNAGGAGGVSGGSGEEGHLGPRVGHGHGDSQMGGGVGDGSEEGGGGAVGREVPTWNEILSLNNGQPLGLNDALEYFDGEFGMSVRAVTTRPIIEVFEVDDFAWDEFEDDIDQFHSECGLAEVTG